MDDYHLTRNDFDQSTSSAFKSLIDSKSFADVTLACADDKQITAHKVILAASSPFFNNILLKNPHQHPLLYLKGINFVDLEAIIKFVYTGETNLAQSGLDTFLAAAQELQVHGLLVDLDVKLNKTNLPKGFGDEENILDGESLHELESLEETTPTTQTEFHNEKYKCGDCNFVSSYSYSLRRHRVKVHNSPSKMSTNTNANESKLSEQNVRSQLMLMEESALGYSVSKYNCEKCDLVTENLMDFRRHMQNTHRKYDVDDEPKQQSEIRPFHGTEQLDSMFEQMDKTVQVKKPKHFCDKCDFKTSHGWNLTRHKKYVCKKRE